MERRLRVLAIVQASTVTGPVKNLLDFCSSVSEVDAGIEVVLATYRRGEERNAFIEAARAADVQIHVIPETGAFDFSVARALSDLATSVGADVIQSHEVKSHFFVRLSGLAGSYPWIAFHHGYTAENLKMRAYNEMDRWSLRRASALVTVSRAFAAQLIARGVEASRITVLQNAVDPAWARRVKTIDASAVREKLGLSMDDEVVMAAGRLSHEKAHIDLIRAMAILKQRRPRAHLLLLGDGPERAALEAAAAGQPVRLMGHVPDLAPYYAIADVMALSSLSEGSPNVLLEAMACGVPSVATATGGTPEIVSHEESALLVPARSPGHLARALDRVLTDRHFARSLAQRAEELIRERHDPSSRARMLAALYRSTRTRRHYDNEAAEMRA